MAVKCDPQTDCYVFAEGQHQRWNILNHFEVKWGQANEIRRMLAQVHKEYYGKEASEHDLWYWGNRYMMPEKELPSSVLALYCRKNGLIPAELAAAS